MNYNDYITTTYTNVGGAGVPSCYVFGFKDNVSVFQYDTSRTFEDILTDVVVNFRADYNYDDYVAFFILSAPSGEYIFSATQTDFLFFEAGGTLTVRTSSSESNYQTDTISDYLADMDDGVNGGYYLGTANGSAVPVNQYGNYSANLTSGQKCIFDYSNLKYNIYNDEYRQEWPVVYNRADQRGYYSFAVSYDGSASFDLSIGKPYNDIYDVGYANGYNNGYIQGRTDYTGAGYTQTGNATPTAFTYIGNAFTAVGGIMALEVLPHVTLGLCFSIPMVFVLIMTIFKLVKK